MKPSLIVGMTLGAMLLGGVLLSGDARSQSSSHEQYGRAVDNIRLADSAVAQVLSEAMNAQYGELNRWKALEDKMKLLTQEVDRHLPLMVQAARKAIENNANAYLSPLDLGRPFEGNLARAKEKRAELGGMLNAERTRQQKINEEIAKMEQSILKVGRGMVGQTMEDLYPDEQQLLGEGAVIVLGAYFGPPGIAAASVVVAGTFAFDAMAKLYYNLKGAGDVVKALSQYLEILRQRKKIIDSNMATLTKGYREIDEVADTLERNEKQHGLLKARISQALGDLGRQASAAQEQEAAKQTALAAKERAKIQAELARVPSSWIRYSPLDRSIFAILRNALAEISESGRGGYDRATLAKGVNDYGEAERREREAWSKKLSAAREQVRKRDEAIRAACPGWTDECNRRYTNEVTRAYEHLNGSAYQDERLFSAEEEELWAQARGRAAKMAENLHAGFARISQDFSQRQEALSRQLEKLQEERRKKAIRPPFTQFPHAITSHVRDAWSGLPSPSPGDVTRRIYDLYSQLEGWQNSLTEAVRTLEELDRKEKAIFKQMEESFDRVWRDYEQLTPDKLRVREKPIPWARDPNRYYGWSFSLYNASFSYQQIDLPSRVINGSFPPMTIPDELKWFQEFKTVYDRDMPEADKILADDARGMKVERLGELLVEALNEYSFRGDWDRERELAQRRFTQRNGAADPAVAPDQSDGAQYLAAMKAAWEKNRKNLEELLPLFKTSSYRLIYTFKNPFAIRPVIEPMAKIPEKIKLYEEIFASLRTGKLDQTGVIKFYEAFRQAYEGRNHSLVMSFISDDWTAGDGTSLADLQCSLRESFNVFNSIRYSMTNLTVTPGSGRRFRVSYRVTITGRIFANNIRHEEKSEVNEEVEIDKVGRVRIVRTLSGKFWQ